MGNGALLEARGGRCSLWIGPRASCEILCCKAGVRLWRIEPDGIGGTGGPEGAAAVLACSAAFSFNAGVDMERRESLRTIRPPMPDDLVSLAFSALGSSMTTVEAGRTVEVERRAGAATGMMTVPLRIPARENFGARRSENSTAGKPGMAVDGWLMGSSSDSSAHRPTTGAEPGRFPGSARGLRLGRCRSEGLALILCSILGERS